MLLGAFGELGVTEPGGAELVQVGKAGRPPPSGPAPARPVRRSRSRLGAELVKEVAAAMAGPLFPATANDGCRGCPAATSCPVDERGDQVTP